jgi:hypothetical protein
MAVLFEQDSIMDSRQVCTVFAGERRIATGALADVAAKAKAAIDDEGQCAPLLVFDNQTGQQVDLDLHGTSEDVRQRFEQPAEDAAGGDSKTPRGPGRPKLGVVAREVTLLPRHWEWLNRQPGGASVALRRLVEEARRLHAGKDRMRESQESAYRFMSAMAGNRAGFEEATRALFAGQRERFYQLVEVWPPDIREYATALASAAFDGEQS